MMVIIKKCWMWFVVNHLMCERRIFSLEVNFVLEQVVLANTTKHEFDTGGWSFSNNDTCCLLVLKVTQIVVIGLEFKVRRVP